jgi:hypothetical protein
MGGADGGGGGGVGSGGVGGLVYLIWRRAGASGRRRGPGGRCQSGSGGVSRVGREGVRDVRMGWSDVVGDGWCG